MSGSRVIEKKKMKGSGLRVEGVDSNTNREREREREALEAPACVPWPKGVGLRVQGSRQRDREMV